MNGKDMNYVGTMYDAFQRGSKLMAERSALNLAISFQAAERVYLDTLASGKSGFQDFVQAMDTAFYSRFHSDELKVEVAPVRYATLKTVTVGDRAHQVCSYCHVGFRAALWWKFCPHCGARMGEKEESV